MVNPLDALIQPTSESVHALIKATDFYRDTDKDALVGELLPHVFEIIKAEHRTVIFTPEDAAEWALRALMKVGHIQEPQKEQIGGLTPSGAAYMSRLLTLFGEEFMLERHGMQFTDLVAKADRPVVLLTTMIESGMPLCVALADISGYALTKTIGQKIPVPATTG